MKVIVKKYFFVSSYFCMALFCHICRNNVRIDKQNTTVFALTISVSFYTKKNYHRVH